MKKQLALHAILYIYNIKEKLNKKYIIFMLYLLFMNTMSALTFNLRYNLLPFQFYQITSVVFPI